MVWENFLDKGKHYVCVCVSHSVVSNPLGLIDYSLGGSSVHGIFQIRILKWVDIYSSRNIDIDKI